MQTLNIHNTGKNNPANVDTPRVNENAFGAQILAQEMVSADFARTLERELNNALQDVKRLDFLFRDHSFLKGYIDTMDGSFTDRDDIDKYIEVNNENIIHLR